MKKKVLVLFLCLIAIIMCLCLTGCNKNDSNSETKSSSTPAQVKEKDLTIEDVLSEFKKQGITVDLESKPYYELIEATNGEMFYLNNEVVKLYEYESREDYNNAVEKYITLKDMPHKGLVVLDTNSQKALDIFQSLK